MSQDRSKIAADCWRRGTEVAVKEQWEYAIEMLSKSVMLAPENLIYRQTLRGLEYKKYHGNKKGAKMGKMKLMGIRGKIKKARMSKDWKAIDRLAEEGLSINPWNAQLNASQAEACLNIGYQEIADFAYRNALEIEPENIKYLRSLGKLLEERGNFAEAIGIYEKLAKLDPSDNSIKSKLNQLSADKVMQRGGYEDAKSTQEMRSEYDYDHVRPTQQTTEIGPGDSREADLERAIRKDPANVDHYLNLTRLYRKNNRHEDAFELLKKAMDASGGHQTVRELLEDVELDLLKNNLEISKEAAKNSDDPAKRELSASLSRDLLKKEIEVYSSRVERYPKESRLKMELATRFMRNKQFDQAIPLFQQASADSRLECEVLVYLGECFVQVRKNDLARRQLEKAIPLINQHEQTDLFKKAHYLAARLAEAAKQLDQAENHLNEILALDYSYRDACDRLEKIQSSRGDEQDAILD